MLVSLLIPLIAVASADIPFVFANAGWRDLPFAGTGNTTQYGTNLGACNGTISIGIPTCTGMRLNITLDNGTHIGTTPILPIVPPCTTNFTNSSTPPTETDWVSYSFDIPMGVLVFNIITLNGTEGTYLGVRTDENPACLAATCTGTSGEFIYIPQHVVFGQAENECIIRGLDLAAITITNFLDATSTLFNCAGAHKHAWVASWNGDDYRDVGIAMYSGAATPGGSINVPYTGDDHVAVLCQPAAPGGPVYYL